MGETGRGQEMFGLLLSIYLVVLEGVILVALYHHPRHTHISRQAQPENFCPLYSSSYYQKKKLPQKNSVPYTPPTWIERKGAFGE